MIKVSFVVPVKNGERFIAQTIRSLQEQSVDNLEIIIVNDHSSDNTAKIIQTVAKKDKRIVFCNLSNTTGVAAGRNAGTKLARGAIVLPSDADDPSYPDRAKISIEELEKNNADIFYGNLMRKYENGKEELRHFQPYDHKMLRNINIVPNSASAYKKEVFDKIGGYDESLKVGEDYDFWLSAQDKGFKFTCLNRPVTFYSMHSGQLTGTSVNKDKIQKRQKWNLTVREKHNIFSVDPEYVKTYATPRVVDFYTNKNYDIWFAPASIPKNG